MKNRTRRLKIVSNVIFVLAGLWAVVTITLIGVYVPIPYGLVGGVTGALVIAGVLIRRRSDPVYATNEHKDDTEP